VKLFNDIRKALLDPAARKDREEIEANAGIVKAISGVATGVTGILTVVSLNIARRHPTVGGLLSAGMAIIALVSYESMNLSKNTENMMSSTTDKVAAAWSEHQFTTRITKGTLVVGPLFGTAITRMLKQPKPSS